MTYTATDAAANHSSADFHATVGVVSSVAWSAVWGQPVGVGVDTFVANAGRTLPSTCPTWTARWHRTPIDPACDWYSLGAHARTKSADRPIDGSHRDPGPCVSSTPSCA